MRLSHIVAALAVVAVLQQGSFAAVCTRCNDCGGSTACIPSGTTDATNICLIDLGCGNVTRVGLSDCSSVSGCPDTEAGQCDDGVNNDAWLDGDTDCDDADCASDPACVPVPTVSSWGIASLGLLLLAGLTIKFRPARVRAA